MTGGGKSPALATASLRSFERMKGGGKSPALASASTSTSTSASVRSFERMLAFFAYKPHDQALAMPTHAPPLLPSREPTRRAHQKPEPKLHVSGSTASHVNANGDGEEQPGPATPEPKQSGGSKKKKRKRRDEEEAPSSYVRATVDGKPVVVSRFFPLPPTASSPVVLSRQEVERARRRARRNAKRAIPGLPKKKRSDGKEDGNDGDGQRKKKKNQKRRRSQRTQLSAAEKKLDAYRRVGEDNMWEPPASGHNLLQERHSFDPWRVLIICMLLNITGGKQVRKVLPGLFLLCPDAETASKVPVEEIEKVIQTLGLQKKRAQTIKRFSQEYLDPNWTHVTQLHGVGKYAADAYAIFCVGKPEEVIPEDHKLIDYWKFVCGKEGKEENSTVFQN